VFYGESPPEAIPTNGLFSTGRDACINLGVRGALPNPQSRRFIPLWLFQVSVDEWCNMWDAYAKDPSSVMDWQNAYMNFMFDLEDASHDGGIDVTEFTLVCSSYGLEKTECEEAFAKMSQGQSEVTREQFAALWKEYFAAEDVNAPGNYIFGKTSF